MRSWPVAFWLPSQMSRLTAMLAGCGKRTQNLLIGNDGGQLSDVDDVMAFLA
jgi:hypothetical protein